MPPISAAGLDFNKLTPRLKDRPIAATTSVLPKAGKPYALRFYRSSSSTAACSMRCRAVQSGAERCRAVQSGAEQCIAALTHSGRSPIHGPACLPTHTLCRHVPARRLPPHHPSFPPRIANIRCRQGRRLHGYRLRLSFCGLGRRLMHVRQTCMAWVSTWAQCGRAAAGLVSPRTRGCGCADELRIGGG